tara:strand:- start:3195 stop:4133 length:939 start_codon:yes stop_codon:yes gene_type:complete
MRVTMDNFRFDKIDYVVCRILLYYWMTKVDYDVNLYFVYKVFCRNPGVRDDDATFAEIKREFSKHGLEMVDVESMQDLFYALYRSVLEHNKQHYIYYIMRAISEQYFTPYDTRQHCVERLNIYLNGLKCCKSKDAITNLARCCICAKMGLYVMDALSKDLSTSAGPPMDYFTVALANIEEFQRQTSNRVHPKLVQSLRGSIESTIRQESFLDNPMWGFTRENETAGLIETIWAVSDTLAGTPREYSERVLHALHMSGMFDDGAGPDIVDLGPSAAELQQLDGFTIELPSTIDMETITALEKIVSLSNALRFT